MKFAKNLSTPLVAGLLLLLALAIDPLYATETRGHDHKEASGQGHEEAPAKKEALEKSSSETKHKKESTADHKDEHGQGGGHDEQEEEGGVTLKKEQTRDIISQALAPKALAEIIQAPAEIDFNEQTRAVLTARSEGWAEKVSVYANAKVKKGQLLATIYSPEFLSAQHEYMLIHKRSQSGDTAAAKESRSLLVDAKQRLKILGLAEEEIWQLAHRGKSLPFQHLHSPIDGTVIDHKLNAGETVQPGQSLYVIANLKTVWASVALTENQLGKVQSGQVVSLTVKAYPGQRFSGKVISIGANMDEITRTVKLRALVDNPKQLLKPGMFATARIEIAGGPPVLAIPEDAVLRSPDGDWVVFIEDKPGRFKPVEVKVTKTIGDMMVIEGVRPGAKVVVQGAFFVQSELAKGGFDIHNH
ncbi:MAG: efflux RND transporter periplasmic adaptor subunit [Gammaproteobacteria bacterium]|nr:efflux RND transporter periplasmic adaptor subunit [Gammaproteobacteria bacterium]